MAGRFAALPKSRLELILVLPATLRYFSDHQQLIQLQVPAHQTSALNHPPKQLHYFLFFTLSLAQIAALVRVVHCRRGRDFYYLNFGLELHQLPLLLLQFYLIAALLRWHCYSSQW